MDIGAMEKPIFQIKAKDIAKNILDSNDITVVTTVDEAGRIIAHLNKFEGEFVNYCGDVTDFTPVIVTKVNFKGKDYLYLEELLFEDFTAKMLEYDTTTVYIDYNVKFVASEQIFDNMIHNGGIVVNFN